MPQQVLTPLSLAIATTLFLSACSSVLDPQPYTQAERDQRIAADLAKMYSQQEPVTGPITFPEAVARALKYNLDYRLKLMESALAAKLHDVSGYEMLPKLVASAGYTRRNNDSGGKSIGIEDNEESLRPSTSEQRYHDLAALSLSWNLLDFGVAYYRSQQKGDQVLMAEERRRRVAQNVVQDVRNAYWRALSAQRLLPDVNRLLVRADQALTAARTAEQQNLMSPPDSLAYQRALLDSIYLLTIRRQDLEFAQAELAALMSLPPGAPLVLADQTEPALPALTPDINHLELLSLQNRPEIMEEWYRKRVNADDLKIAKAELWPNINLNLDYQFDSNKFLYNNSWMAVGAQIAVNMIRLVQLPSVERAQEAQTETDDTRRIALSMAILTEVRVGALRYQLSTQELKFADESLDVDRKLLDYAKASSQSTSSSELEVIRAESRYLLSEYQREGTYSDAQAAWGRLYNSIGLDVLPQAIDSEDVKTLAKAVALQLQQQEEKNLLASAQTSSRDVDAR